MSQGSKKIEVTLDQGKPSHNGRNMGDVLGAVGSMEGVQEFRSTDVSKGFILEVDADKAENITDEIRNQIDLVFSPETKVKVVVQ